MVMTLEGTIFFRTLKLRRALTQLVMAALEAAIQPLHRKAVSEGLGTAFSA